MELAPDFDEFIGCLNAREVEFLIVAAFLGRDAFLLNKRRGPESSMMSTLPAPAAKPMANGKARSRGWSRKCIGTRRRD